jgi:hypothetical protein
LLHTLSHKLSGQISCRAAPKRTAAGCCTSSGSQIQQQQAAQQQQAESIQAASAAVHVLSAGLAGWSEDWQAASTDQLQGAHLVEEVVLGF